MLNIVDKQFYTYRLTPFGFPQGLDPFVVGRTFCSVGFQQSMDETFWMLMISDSQCS
jgi:hypothetical protein